MNISFEDFCWSKITQQLLTWVWFRATLVYTQQLFEMLFPRKLTWQCKIHYLKMYFPFKHGDLPVSCWFSGGVDPPTKSARCQLRELRTMRCSKVEMPMFLGIPQKYMWEHSRKNRTLGFLLRNWYLNMEETWFFRTDRCWSCKLYFNHSSLEIW